VVIEVEDLALVESEYAADEVHIVYPTPTSIRVVGLPLYLPLLFILI
jgi:hypothetical protein